MIVRPAAQETDTRDHSLDDARQLRRAHPGFRGGDHHQGGAQRHQHVSAQSRGLVRQLAAADRELAALARLMGPQPQEA